MTYSLKRMGRYMALMQALICLAVVVKPMDSAGIEWLMSMWGIGAYIGMVGMLLGGSIGLWHTRTLAAYLLATSPILLMGVVWLLWGLSRGVVLIGAIVAPCVWMLPLFVILEHEARPPYTRLTQVLMRCGSVGALGIFNLAVGSLVLVVPQTGAFGLILEFLGIPPALYGAVLCALGIGLFSPMRRYFAFVLLSNSPMIAYAIFTSVHFILLNTTLAPLPYWFAFLFFGAYISITAIDYQVGDYATSSTIDR